MTATKQPATATLERVARKLDPIKLDAWGARLKSEFQRYESDRKLAELKWARNARQFQGIYDPDIEAQLDKQRSAAYPKLTRVKCVSMVSRLMNLLFPASDKNWTLAASPVPNLDKKDLDQVLAAITNGASAGQPIEDAVIEIAIQEFAKQRAQNLELEIEDQLLELGGSRAVDYVSLCRKVLYSGVVYGMGVMKGPFVREQKQRNWSRDATTGLLTAKQSNVLRPHFDSLSIWDYYPDLSAKYRSQMDGQFERMVLARHQLMELMDRGDFFSDVIKKYLADNAKGNYRRRAYESELKAMGVQQNVNDQDGRKYEIIIWDGFVSGHDLAAAGVELTDEQLGQQIEAQVYTLDDKVIKADINPWVTLDVDFKVNTYHHFVFEEDESTLLGNGLPNIMRDSQMSVAAGARMVLDNASVTCGPQLEINRDLADPKVNQDLTTVRPYKIWYRRGMGQDAQVPMVKNIDITSHTAELLTIVKKFEDFADVETFVNAGTGGDMQQGPSEPFRTAAGASMLHGQAALPFKDVVRNFDLFTQSVLGSIVAFNRQFNLKPTVQGDAQVIARGATSLIAKEVRGMAIDNMVATLSEEEKTYLNWYELLTERLKSREFDVGSMVCSKAESKIRDQQAAAAAAAEKQSRDELIRGEIRQVLSQAAKNLTQSDKNAAAADATKVNTLLDALEKGVQHELAAGTGGLTGGTAGAAGGSAANLQQPQRPGDAGAAPAAGPAAGGLEPQVA